MKLSAITASMMSMVGLKPKKQIKRKLSKAEKRARDTSHLLDLQTRLQIVADRKPAKETVDVYGTNPNGFRQHRKFTKVEIAKMVA